MTLLQTLLEEYLNSPRSGRNLSALARRTGVGETTLRRIVQGECKPELATAMALLGVVTSRKNMVEVLFELYPDQAKLMESVFSAHKGRTATEAEGIESLKKLLVQEATCRVIHIAATREGTTRERIRYLWGESGESALEECIAHGVVEERMGKVRFLQDGFSVTDIEVAIEVCKHLANCFDRRNLGKKRACLAVHTEAVNEDGLAQIREVILKAVQDICEIKENPRFQGRIPFFATFVLNSLDNPREE